MVRLQAVGLRYGGAGVAPRSGATEAALRSGATEAALRSGATEAALRSGATEAAPVLHDLSFAIEPGGFRWLLGASGAGKTSLLRLLTLSVRPSGGRLNVLGTPVERARRAELPALRRRIGMIYQDFRLLPHLSAFDNVALPLRLAGRPEGQVRADVDEMLRWVTLTRRADARPAALSGGEQQRVAIARAVIGRPDLLLADEPTGNLDDVQAMRLMQLLLEMNRLGTTVVVATHNQALVDRYPGDTLVLRDGWLIHDGPPSDAWPESQVEPQTEPPY